MTEDTHLVVWVRGANSLSLDSDASSDSDESSDADDSSDTGSVDTGSGVDTGTSVDTAAGEATGSGDTALVLDSGLVGDTGSDDFGGVVSTDTEAAYVPLILPRTRYCELPDLDYTRREKREAQQVMACDQELYEQLQMVLDPDIVDEAIESCDATLLLEACSNPLDEGGCGLVQIGPGCHHRSRFHAGLCGQGRRVWISQR